MLYRDDPRAPFLQRWKNKIFFRLTSLTFALTFPVYELFYLLWRCPEMLPSLFRAWSFSMGRNPYLAHRRLPQKLKGQRPGDDFVYGEVLLPGFDHVLREMKIGPEDTLIDLGCGRGKLVMMAAAKGIRAHGIELVPLHLRCAKYASRRHLPLASFEQEDILKADLSRATVIWASGTCWHNSLREALAEKLIELKPGVRIISVSAPLPHPRLKRTRTLYGWTSWGRDTFFVQEVLPPEESNSTEQQATTKPPAKEAPQTKHTTPEEDRADTAFSTGPPLSDVEPLAKETPTSKTSSSTAS